jgi:hypothetical protein
MLLNRILVVLGGCLLIVSVRAAENADAVKERMTKDITFLASDECEGRGVNTKGISLAAEHIAAEFKKAGLAAPFKDSYYQQFTMPGSSAGLKAELQEPTSVILQGSNGQQIELKLGKDVAIAGLSGTGKLSAPLVFVGYAATTEKAGYDDFKDIDIKGKIAVVLRKVPRAGKPDAPPFEGGVQGPHAGLSVKAANAEKHGAVGVIIVNDSSTAAGRDGDKLMDFDYLASDRGVKIPVVQLRRDVVDQIVQSSLNVALLDLEKDIDRDLKPHSTALDGWKASLETKVNRVQINTKNVVGILEGAGPLAKETVVIGAHYDHLGLSHPGSLARDKKPQIHHGADDNGSGTTALLELARRYGAMQNRQGRKLVFVAFSGEESGLYGSTHYVSDPVSPIKDTVAMVNLDMVGRLGQDKTTGKDKLLVEGSGTAKDFDDLIERLNKKYEFKLSKDPGGFGPSDHASFYAKKIPVIFYWTGNHPDYHKPSDTADKINVPGMMKIVDLAQDTIDHVATVKDKPEYVEVKRKFVGGGMGNVPRIGIVPSYGDDGDGILLDGVAEGGPAEKAGLKTGDRITAIGGKPFKGMEGYMPLMTGREKGTAIEFTILRDGKTLTVPVTP